MPTPNVALAPINAAQSIAYTSAGIDLIHDPDIANGRKSRGLGAYVRWVASDIPLGDFTDTDADALIKTAGYRRITPWRQATALGSAARASEATIEALP